MLKACPLLGGCRGASHLTNSLIYKKVPQIAVCKRSESEKLKVLCIFGQKKKKKKLKIQESVLFCQICTLWDQKLQNFCKSAHIQKIRKRSTFENFAPSSDKNLGMGLVEASQMHMLRKQVGLRGWAPSIFCVCGLEYPFASPPQKSYILITLD